MNRKSLESHQARRTCANYQRGNTKVQRISKAITNVLSDYPKQMINIVKELIDNNISWLNYTWVKWFRCIYFFRNNNNSEKNKVSITINEKLWNQTIELNNQKTQDRYIAENISNETLANEIKSIINFLETGKLGQNSKLKISNFEDMMDDFDPSEWLPKEVIEETWFDQKIYEKILLEEGEEEAVKYGKWLRWAKKPENNVSK